MHYNYILLINKLEVFHLKKKLLFSFIIIYILSILLIGCNQKITISQNLGEMKVHYIDVGQGDSILIQVNNKNLLIDSGPKSGKAQLLKYLNSLNVKKLDYVIATHPHEDHIGNMADVINNYDVSKFYAPKVLQTTKTFEKMIEALKNKDLKINTIKAGDDSLDLGDGTKVSVFAPIDDTYDNLNNYSPIIKIEYGNNSFLFTGDAEKQVEKEVLNKGYDLKADVLKFGHHGSSSSTSSEFFHKVNPSIGVICVGLDNSFGHPHKETLKLIKDNNLTTYRTDLDGNIILISNGNEIKKST